MVIREKSQTTGTGPPCRQEVAIVPEGLIVPISEEERGASIFRNALKGQQAFNVMSICELWLFYDTTEVVVSLTERDQANWVH
jgi:hypothetical protein